MFSVPEDGTEGAMRSVTTAGCDLFHLAASALGDATQWVRIAALNGLLDPVLTGVITLTLPDVDLSATGGLPDQGSTG